MNEANYKNISIVIPICNEEQNIPIIYRALKEKMEMLKLDYEIIFIDDCSIDRSEEIIKELHNKDLRIIYARLNRRNGQTKALVKGFGLAEGELILTLDADMEHNPEYIKFFLEKINEGYDAVIGWRKEREDGGNYRKIFSSLGNKMINLLFKTSFRDVASPFRVFKKELIKGKKLYNGYHRFIPLIFKKNAKIYELDIKLEKRRFGKSHYNFLKVFNCTVSVIRLLFFDKQNRELT